MKKHNFNAGPSQLPLEAIENGAKAVLDFAGTGISILSTSHRTKEYDAVNNGAVNLFRELLEIPENYKIGRAT
ncbi:MAG: 3-phosphoserine/phosphohydroxythreonine transaminase, partial [Tidjanibacter sp.]|nr:3-phosphoserine/phosphohydroxythreonine transaminase [Tidjanibacter sp.]